MKIVLSSILACLCLFLLPAGPALGAPVSIGVDPVLWPEAQRSFFMDGPGLLLTPEQRTELRSINQEARELWIQRFLDKDPAPETKANELLEAIERRRRLADSEIASPADVRWQILFLNGRPQDRLIIDCGQAFKPTEVWTYVRGVDPQTGKAWERGAVVYRPGAGQSFRLWIPSDSKRALYIPQMEYWLEQWEELRGRIQAARFDLQTCRDAARKIDESTGIPGLTGARPNGSVTVRPIDNSAFLAAPRDLGAWAREAAKTEAPPPARPLDVQSVELRFPEREGQRMKMRALLRIGTEGLEAVEEEGKRLYSLTVQGLVEQDGQPFEEVRLRYRLPVPEDGEPLLLAVDRWLRPDKPFLLRLEIKDESGDAETRLTRGLMVPVMPTPDPMPAGIAGGEVVPEAVKKGEDSLILLPPAADVALGLWRAEALVTGQRIKKVVFLVDGERQLTRTNPPFTAEVRLAHFPTEQTVRIEGYDENGDLVAADEVILNQARGALGVWIVDPPRGSKVSGRTRARAEVMVPDGRRVQSLEFKVNDEPVATLTRPPWQTEIQVPDTDLAYVTAVVTLDDGSRAEAVRFLRSPQYLEEVEVNLVELYVAVTDRAGKPVKGLTQDDFEVLEGGKPQELSKFELVESLPLTLGILLDTSGSMAESLALAQSAASDFLRSVVKPRDKSFAVSFSGRTRLDMPPTDDVEAVVRSFENLQAVGDTALHDAIVHSLYYFRGVKGQRALVLLSDGDDNASNFQFKDALEYARRSGVAIYAIGYNLQGLSGLRGKLNELAEATGGRLFTTNKPEDLPGIYAQIEQELRSRYLLAYNTNQASGQAGYREVEVRVKKGLKARTIRGYYP
ncbi:MAG TPA: VWA domain-containing protein [Thermoanaerobaculia bacterium]